MTTQLEDYVTVTEAAALLRVHKSTVRRWIDQGELPAYRVGQRRLALKRADVDRLVWPATPATTVPQLGMVLATGDPSPTLTPDEQHRGRAAMAAARALSDEVLRKRGGVPFSPSWEILDELRDERSRQLS